ncbi:MAG: 8-amino-7-oxononanoate synthase [bacterium]|nr:8-amino-7-oxononanoate synthase [bacterium]
MTDYFLQELEQMEREGLRRHTEAWPASGSRIGLADGRILLNFSANDYLGLAQDPHVVRRAMQAIERWGCGASASRLMCGTLELHEELEAALAQLVGGESALVFSSGFGMNVGVVAALAGRGDIIFADRLSHASLIDGARLSGAEVKRFAHNDAAGLARLVESTPCRGRRLIVTESVFSMDGDLAPLTGLRTLAARHQALLLVDEAHAIGIWGRGGGVCRQLGETAQPDIVAGTLGKALGSLGGFVVCSAACREFLVNRARSFIYATALPPPCLGAALGAIERIAQEPDMGERLLERARTFHGLLAAEGLRPPEFRSQIIPVPVGKNDMALELARRLRERGLLMTAVRPPTVPRGTARLRLSVTLAHEPSDLQWAAEQIGQAARELVLI